MDRHEVKVVYRPDFPAPATQRITSLFPLATMLADVSRTIEGGSQPGSLLILSRDNAASPLQYANARSSLLAETNTMLETVGRPPFPAYTVPTTREVIKLATKK